MNEIIFNETNEELKLNEFNSCIVKYRDTIQYCQYFPSTNIFMIINSACVNTYHNEGHETWKQFLKRHYEKEYGYEIIHIGISRKFKIIVERF